MDFSEFRKAVGHEATRIAVGIAPAQKGAPLAVSTVYAPWATPFAAAIPPVLLHVDPTLFLLVPEYRGEVEEDSRDVDYTKLGELAAMAYLKGR